MKKIQVYNIDKTKADKDLCNALARVLTYDEPEYFDDSSKWWEDWFLDKIPGDKLTIAAEEDGEIIGITRFWKTPYCNDIWLIEGLEVISTKRKRGIGKAIVQHGISLIQERSDDDIFVNIANRNIPSIKLHESLGFEKTITGANNSLGDYRAHIDRYKLSKSI